MFLCVNCRNLRMECPANRDVAVYLQNNRVSRPIEDSVPKLLLEACTYLHSLKQEPLEEVLLFSSTGEFVSSCAVKMQMFVSYINWICFASKMSSFSGCRTLPSLPVEGFIPSVSPSAYGTAICVQTNVLTAASLLMPCQGAVLHLLFFVLFCSL